MKKFISLVSALLVLVVTVAVPAQAARVPFKPKPTVTAPPHRGPAAK